MKKILILIVLSLGYLLGYSQFPITQSIGSPKTKVVNKGIFYSDSAIIVTGYTDTTQANLGYIKNIPHVIIATSNDIWIRNIAATAWLQLVNIGSGATDTLAWMLSGNNATGMGGVPVMGTTSYTDFNFATNNLKRFSVSKDGIQDSTVNVLPLGIDTTTGYLSYARAGGGGGGGTDSSIRKGYGIIIDISGTNRTISGDSLQFATRSRLMHVTDSLLTIIGAKPSGSGTTDYLARWINSTTLGIGATRDDGTNVGIGVVPGTYKLNVNGSLNVATSIYLPSSSGTTGNIYKNGTKWLHNGGLAGSQLSNIYLGRDAGNDTALFGNIGIGREALKLNNGYDDIAIGNYAMANSNGYDGGDASSFGIAIGARSMEFATAAHRPLAIGPSTGLYWNNSSVSVIAIGKITASANYGGVGSTYLGASIASQGVKDTADWNSIVGADAWQYLGKAHGNATIGAYIAPNATTASYNSGSGYSALGGLTTGSFNTALSYYAGFGITSGDNNVHIGRFADAYGGNYSNKLVINSDASGSGRHLINGDFSSRKVGIDRSLAEIAAGSQALQVNGSIYATTNIKLGGLTNGAGHKAVRFNTTDSSFYLADTTAVSSGVTSVATTANTGLLGGTITSTGTLYIDTLLVSTRAWRKKLADSLGALISGGGGTPAGANTEVQYNNSGAFGASANFTYDGTLSLKYSSSAELLKLYAQSSSDAAVVYHHSTPSLKWYTFLDNAGADYNIGTSLTPIFKIFRNGHVVNGGATDNGYGYDLQTGDGRFRANLFVDNNLGVGLTSASAYLHLKAGTATAGTAPIKLNTGTALTTPEDGAIEYHGSHIYFTIGSTRYQLDQQVNADSVTTKWSTLGNTLTGTSKFGSLSNHGFNFVTNDVVRGGFTSAGAFSTIQDVIFNGIYFGQGPVNGLSHIRIGDATTLRDITAGSLLNTGIGISALKQNTTGDFNLAVGYTALEKNTTGSDQNAFGRQAGQNNVGDRNLFLGGASGVNCLTCTYQIHVENSNGTGNGVSTGRDNVIIGNRIGNLSPSLHRSIVIADSVDIIFMKDSSGKAYLNAPTIVGSQGEANSTLQSAGSFSAGYVAKTGTYTATINDYTINCTSGTFTVTLPTAVGCAGRLYVITNSGGGTITVGTTSSQTFANVVATPTTLTMAAVGSRTVQSDGANWLLLSSL